MHKLLKIQGLGVYTLLNYFDKGLTFIIPLLVLRLFPDNYVYADLEYLISITLIISSFLDFGLRTYLFYGYRTSANREEFCRAGQTALLGLTVFYILLGTALYAASGFNEFIIFCVARIVFLCFTNVQSTIYRLRDKPTNIFLYLTTASLVTSVIIIIVYLTGHNFNLLLYSIPYMVFCAGAVGMLAFRSRLFRKNLPAIVNMLRSAVVFGWPIIVMQMINAIQTNFAKIYGYNKIPLEDFQSLAVLLRCFTIVILAYSAAQAFYQKTIFTTERSFRLTYPKYMGACFCGFLLMFIFIFISNRLGLFAPIPLDINFSILITTYVLLINRAYVEQFFSKHNKLRYPLSATSIGFVSFLLLFLIILLSGKLTITGVLFSLMAAEIINFAFIIYKYITVIRKLELSDGQN